MPFKNFLVAGTILKREAIQSPNYVAGTSGWTINRDGSSEFSNTVVRGEIDIGPPNSKVVISPNVPALLTTFYASLISPVTINLAWIGQFVDAANYRYQISGKDVLNRPYIGFGFVQSGVVYESRNERWQTLSAITGVIQRYGEVTPTSVRFDDALVNVGGEPGFALPANADLQFQGVSLYRGAIVTRQYSGNPILTATGGGAELSLGNMGSFLYNANRAFQIDVWFTAQFSAAGGNGTFRIRRGTGIGGVVDIVRVYPSLSSNRFEVQYSGILITGGSPVTQDLTPTVQAAAGSNLTVFGTGGTQGQIKVYDIGDANAYPGFPSL